MRDKLEATRSEIFDVVPFQERRQLGIAEHTENSGLGCAQSPRPRSLRSLTALEGSSRPLNEVDSSTRPFSSNPYRTTTSLFDVCQNLLYNRSSNLTSNLKAE